MQAVESINAELAKLNGSQRAALRKSWAGVIGDLKIRTFDNGAAVQVGFRPVNGRRLWAYAWVGPRGRLLDVQSHVTGEDGRSTLFD
ncbi:MAG: hypothetical protein EBR82_11205 [Caulobacteraceae bacterium]|jgi:hypothetical protein|nr:hypothetical protein [Caulobacteraceae bacterium]